MKKVMSITAVLLFFPVNIATDFVLQQIPLETGWAAGLLDISVTIAVLAVIIYFGFRYFNKQLDKKDLIIATKDEEIKELNKFINDKLFTLAHSAAETFTKAIKNE